MTINLAIVPMGFDFHLNRNKPNFLGSRGGMSLLIHGNPHHKTNSKDKSGMIPWNGYIVLEPRFAKGISISLLCTSFLFMLC